MREKIAETLEQVDKNIVGPFVLGEEFSMGDIMLYPWLERWSVLESMFGLTIPLTLTKIHRFVAAMKSRASVKTALANVSP